MSGPLSAAALERRIVDCDACPRLREHCAEVARVKRRAYRDDEYWGRPVPSFGPVGARLLVVGLAPGAHGANRTGRVFTGDSSGDWLYRALHDHGFANRAESVRAGDGLKLRDARVTCVVRCAPPQNKPTAAEQRLCRQRHLDEELRALRRLRVVMVLGRIAFDGFRRAFEERGGVWAKPPAFAHGAECAAADRRLILLSSYHPSRQNTQTGRLTRTMFDRPFARARAVLEEAP